MNTAKSAGNLTFQTSEAHAPSGAPDLSSAEISTSRPIAAGTGSVTIDGKSEGFEYEARKIADRVAQFFVKAESAAAELIGGLSVAFSHLARNPKTSAAIGAAGMLALSGEEALANRQPDGASDTNYLRFGQQLQTNTLGSTVWVHSVDQNGAGKVASGILWDPFHVVTAAHAKISAGETNTMLQVGLGSNSYSNDCQVANVANVIVHPNWDFTHLGDSLGFLQKQVQSLKA